MVSALIQMILVVCLNTAGQLALKTGSDALSSPRRLLGDPLSVFAHEYFLVGAMLYGVSFALYVNALSRLRLSIAYPFMGLTYVLVVVASVVLLNEPINWRTGLGVLLVFAGITLLGVGAQS